MKPVRVIIVDDHKLFRKGMAAMLNSVDGLEMIGEAGNGVELLELLTTTSADVILMDLDMPEMDGMEATPKVRALYPEIKILVISMHQEDKFILHLMENGANGYLLKDAEPEEVEEAIFSVVQNGFYFTDHISKVMLTGLVKKEKIIPTFNAQINLTQREKDVLDGICQELTTKEIADKLFLSPRTVDGYRNNLMEKIGAKNTAGLVVFAAKNGLLS